MINTNFNIVMYVLYYSSTYVCMYIQINKLFYRPQNSGDSRCASPADLDRVFGGKSIAQSI